MQKTEDDHAPAGGAEWREAPGLVARGVCMGTADVVPGVSGGTMALILGIYARLVLAIRTIDVSALRHLLSGRFSALLTHVHWRFLAAVVCGQAIGIVLFTKVVPLPTLIHSHPELVYGAFFGLIVGSIGLLSRDLLRERVTPAMGFAAAGGVACGLLVVNLVRNEPTPESPWFVFLCGCVSICAMILPGISGSFVLLILRKYAYVLGAVGEVIHPTTEAGRLEPLLTIVAPFALGCLIGLLSFSRLLGWLLQRAERETLSFMTGLMAGSLWVLWPFQERVFEVIRHKQRLMSSTPVLPEDWGGVTIGALVLSFLGIAAVLAMDVVARRQKPA